MSTQHNPLSEESGTPVTKWPPSFNRTFIMAIIISFAGFMVLDFLFYGFLTGDFFNTPNMYDEPNMGIMLIAYALISCLYASLYFLVFNNASEFRNFLFGLLIASVAFLPSIFFNLSLYEDYDLGRGAADFIFKFFEFGVVGVLVGAMAKRSQKGR